MIKQRFIILLMIISALFIFACDDGSSSGGNGGGEETDIQPPLITALSPDDNYNVDVRTEIWVTFQEAIDCTTVNQSSLIVNDGSDNILGQVSCSGSQVIFLPDDPLSYFTTYTATIAGSITDLAGNPVGSDYNWSFETQNEPIDYPEVNGKYPEDSATNVPVSDSMTVTFDQTMAAGSINSSRCFISYSKHEQTYIILADVSYDGTTLTINPTYDLPYDTEFLVTISHDVLNSEGIGLAEDYTWSFSTGAPLSGAIDTSFSNDGFSLIASGSVYHFNALAVQTDGKIVAAGDYWPTGTTRAIAVARLNEDGSLDTEFGTNGIVHTPIRSFDTANDVAIQDDGKIVVVGSSNNSNSSSTRNYFAIVRYNTDGTLDTTFVEDGILEHSIGDDCSANAVAIDTNDRIIVVGGADAGTEWRFIVTCYLGSDGSKDTLFGTNGVYDKLVVTGTGNFSEATSVAIQNDNKIVAAGHAENTQGYFDFGVIRLNTNGTLDTGFDADGQVVTSIFSTTFNYDEYCSDVKLDGNQKIVLAGYVTGDNSVGLIRYNSNGSLDTTFDTDGIKTQTISLYRIDTIQSAVIQSTGEILVAGEATISASGYGGAIIARFTSAGSLDTSFSSDGFIHELDTTSSTYYNDIALQADGSIVAAGRYYPNGPHAVITRYWP